ncbi:MAG: ATP cone domain-containing protein [Candidatus Njordarchaeia archaeon]
MRGKKSKKIKIIKMDGSEEEFMKEKIVNSVKLAGAPEGVAKEIAEDVEKAVEEGMTTRQIRRMVLNELEKRNPEWADNWKYYDRIVKGRITFENGKFIVVQKGHLYLGRQVKDIGPKGLSNYEEVEGILREMEEDLKYGVPKRTINSRTFVLFMAVLKSKKMKKEDKIKSIEAINKFREKMGWKPFEVKKPIE